MGKTELTKRSIDADNRRRHPPKLFHPVLREFFTQIPHKIQDGIKSHLTKFKKDREVNKLGSSIMMRRKVSPAQLESDLKNQMLAWKENPTWVDEPPEIKVSIPKGSLCNLSVKVDVGLPPDAIYKIVTDPDSRRVFKNIKEVISRKVLIDDGLRQVVDVEQAAIWKFLFCSGTIAVHVVVDQNRADHSMKFKQVNCEFMKKFEGHWRVEPLFVDQHMCSARRPPSSLEEYTSCTGGKGRVGSTVRLDQLILPSVVPPPPISWYLRGITTRTTETLITDLRDEASRIRQGIGAALKPNRKTKTVGDEEEDAFDEIDRVCDIKQRWAMRRRVMRSKRNRK